MLDVLAPVGLLAGIAGIGYLCTLTYYHFFD